MEELNKLSNSLLETNDFYKNLAETRKTKHLKIQEAQERCNSLYLKGKMKNDINKKLKAKAEAIKINAELSQCTFQPQLNNRKSSSTSNFNQNKSTQFKQSNNSNEEDFGNNNINIKLPSQVASDISNRNLYDKYKNKITNMMAFKSKEVYMKKKIEGNKISKPLPIKRLDINTVLDNNKTVLNDKLTKNFVKRYQKARESEEEVPFGNLNSSYKEGNLGKPSSGKLVRSLTMRCFFKINDKNNNIISKNIYSRTNRNQSVLDQNASELMSNLKSPSLKFLRNSLRRELSQVDL